jgi:hypothetical protein
MLASATSATCITPSTRLGARDRLRSYFCIVGSNRTAITRGSHPARRLISACCEGDRRHIVRSAGTDSHRGNDCIADM